MNYIAPKLKAKLEKRADDRGLKGQERKNYVEKGQRKHGK